MTSRLIIAFGIAAAAAAASWPSLAGEPAAPASVTADPEAAKTVEPVSPPAPDTPEKDAASVAAPEEAAPKEQAEETHAPPEPQLVSPAAEAAAQSEPKPAPAASVPQTAPEAASPKNAAAPTRPDIQPVPTAEADALKMGLSALPAGASDEERNERAALVSFYESRGYAALWVDAQAGYTLKGAAAADEMKRANEWGLDARDFATPGAAGGSASPETAASAELKTALAILKYARYARGGRIVNPSEQLSSYLDRRPQLLKPETVLEGAAAADRLDLFLRGLHPSHPQFERLRQKYLALSERGKPRNSEAKRLLANMEEWRWMPVEMGDVYIWNNIPEYIQRVVTKGEIVRKERIVAGQLDKQTPIFTRPLRKITFKPTWIVPDSIKVRELWPSLLRGGGLMREWKLEVQTKEGAPVDWRRIDWSGADIRTYEVVQPYGSKSVMGKVKFSFPSQHTVFMHDAMDRDKWMFNATRRTYSHGCMRLQNPIGLAEILLREDKGWDAARVRREVAAGPNNNEIAIEHKIPVHITYFTALVDDDGKLHTFHDVYGHERRITLALEGKWGQIVKGRDHLAPVELNTASARPRHYAEDDAGEYPGWRRGGSPRSSSYTRSGFFDSLFGGYR
jgi:L,D-transpeptidase YcbB